MPGSLLLGAVLLATGSKQFVELPAKDTARARAAALRIAKILGIKADMPKNRAHLHEGVVYLTNLSATKLPPVSFVFHRNFELKVVLLNEVEKVRSKSRPMTQAIDERAAYAKAKPLIAKIWNVSDLSAPKIKYVKGYGPSPMTFNTYIGSFGSTRKNMRYFFWVAAEDGKILNLSSQPAKKK